MLYICCDAASCRTTTEKQQNPIYILAYSVIYIMYARKKVFITVIVVRFLI